ncbi:hypothetical protein ATE84_0129 [Aquimarina sp. MAR_2010_214]|uniref:DUF983 domain-containing protein n=1 Tax=Aquimarina sp. MAR_2010_214 TaxID=1250026 RepID=UPI000C6FD978|nr:DUF983 domain-containing protein [Aquimarina sp. MAR_2010_214]PKV48139.1 hypothetical protein ATE84_0129 [Aquimarina sp. MAR_2010_214]
MKTAINIIKGKCSKCEEGNVFIKKRRVFALQLPKMNEKCPHCNHKFLIEPGYFYGAMYVSYGLTVAEGVAIYLLSSFFITKPIHFFIILSISAVLLSTTNYKYARILWIYLFTKKAKKESEEINSFIRGGTKETELP